jgi:hypothetical protein
VNIERASYGFNLLQGHGKPNKVASALGVAGERPRCFNCPSPDVRFASYTEAATASKLATTATKLTFEHRRPAAIEPQPLVP